MNTERETMSRRVMGFIVSGEAVGTLVRAGQRLMLVKSQCPESAVFYTAFFVHERNAFVCVYEDDSFDEVADGAIIPIADQVQITDVSAVMMKASEAPDGCTCHEGGESYVCDYCYSQRHRGHMQMPAEVLGDTTSCNYASGRNDTAAFAARSFPHIENSGRFPNRDAVPPD